MHVSVVSSKHYGIHECAYFYTVTIIIFVHLFCLKYRNEFDQLMQKLQIRSTIYEDRSISKFQNGVISEYEKS